MKKFILLAILVLCLLPAFAADGASYLKTYRPLDPSGQPRDPSLVPLPVNEDFTDPIPNFWTMGSFNWGLNSSLGNPGTAVAFNPLPLAYNYSVPLTSAPIDVTGAVGVRFSYDLCLLNADPATVEGLSVQVLSGSAWQEIENVTNQTYLGEDIPWSTKTWNISSLISGGQFQIRFVAYGTDSAGIEAWLIDNVRLEATPQLDPPPNIHSELGIYPLDGQIHPFIYWDVLPPNPAGVIYYVPYHAANPEADEWEYCGCAFPAPPAMDMFYPEVFKRFYIVLSVMDWDAGLEPVPVPVPAAMTDNPLPALPLVSERAGS